MRKIFFLVTCICIFFVTCSKEGPMGPEGKQGEQGEQGKQGEKGIDGINGIDGTSLLSGNGIPGNSIGKNGDFYLDKNNLNIYGPKTNAGWGEGTSIKGKDGQNGKDGTNGNDGKDGSKILSGAEIPSLELGSIGDFYFDIQNITIYGPKTATGWGTPISLRTPNGLNVTVLLYRNHSFRDQEITEVTDGWIPIPLSYDMESTIAIDSRFQDVYDNGITMLQFRKSGGNWATHIYQTEWDPIDTTMSKLMEIYLIDHLGDDKEISIQKDKIKLYGHAENYTTTEIKAYKIDIKVIFIPATSVLEMTQKNIDINDANKISQYLRLN